VYLTPAHFGRPTSLVRHWQCTALVFVTYVPASIVSSYYLQVPVTEKIQLILISSVILVAPVSIREFVWTRHRGLPVAEPVVEPFTGSRDVDWHRNESSHRSDQTSIPLHG